MFPQAKIPSKYKFFPAYPSSYILQITAFNRTISINDHLITVIMHSFSTTTYICFFFFFKLKTSNMNLIYHPDASSQLKLHSKYLGG